jgi:hypothetical protein
MTVVSPALDLRAAYEHAEAARIAIAAELATVRTTLRRERALHAHPELTVNLLELVRGDTDEDYASRASTLANAILSARLDVRVADSNKSGSPWASAGHRARERPADARTDPGPLTSYNGSPISSPR